MTPAELERKQRIAERERVEQGLPPQIEDPVILSKIVGMMLLPKPPGVAHTTDTTTEAPA